MTTSDFLTQLHEKNLRVTPQRLLVLDILAGGEHLDAESVYQQARQRDPSISLATVYRTLDILERSGLLQQRFFSREHKREYYESASKAEHYHFRCVRCHTVIEVQTRRLAQLRDELQSELGLVMRHACVCLEGLCAQCAAAAAPTLKQNLTIEEKELQ